MVDFLTFEKVGEIGVVHIDSPPVNALGLGTRKAIAEGMRLAAQDEAIAAVVLICGGRTFFAGADISEFDSAPQSPTFPEVFDLVENLGKPIVAAIHGTALGGGLELALTCNYRIGVPSAKVGLPEVALGLLPGAGGTQRLPRLIGPELALDMIAFGKPIGAKKALELGILDALANEDSLKVDAIAFARNVVAAGGAMPKLRDKQDRVDPFKGNSELFDTFRKKNARAFRGFKAPENIIKAIEAAVALPFDEGSKREGELFLELLDSVESQAQRYYFFAERQTSKIPDVPDNTPTVPVKSVGVIGAGTMGGGITMNFLNVGIPVTLVEMTQEALDRGIGVIRKNYEITAQKGRLTQDQLEQRMALINPALSLDALADVDLVIEAVFEQMSVKTDIFGKLDKICKQDAILASNTSYLDIDEIARATTRPEWVVGLHFFSPANVMRLLEVVRGAKTSSEVIATSMKLAKAIAKVPVLARTCHGFIANRIMEPYILQAQALLLEGPSPTEIDKAICDYGFAMGPFAMFDLVGLDVAGRDSNERNLTGDMVKAGRLGQKKNGGFYDYDEKRQASPSAVAAQIIAEFAAYKGVTNRGSQSDEEIVARLLYPVVNEGAKILEEGIAIRAADIDVACILGYNWPVYTGGPMFWADVVGLPRIVAKLRELEAEHGERYKPARLLVDLAEKGGTFTR